MGDHSKQTCETQMLTALCLQICAGDCRDENFVKSVVTGVDAIVCALGTTAFPSLRSAASCGRASPLLQWIATQIDWRRCRVACMSKQHPSHGANAWQQLPGRVTVRALEEVPASS